MVALLESESETPVMVEPAGMVEKSKRTRARRRELVAPELRPANMAVPEPLEVEPVGVS